LVKSYGGGTSVRSCGDSGHADKYVNGEKNLNKPIEFVPIKHHLGRKKLGEEKFCRSGVGGGRQNSGVQGGKRLGGRAQKFIEGDADLAGEWGK